MNLTRHLLRTHFFFGTIALTVLGTVAFPVAGQPPWLADYSNTGCLEGRSFGPCGDDDFDLTVEGSTLNITHLNATYNCCPDDIAVSLEIEDTTLILTEEEILTNPCFCLCCYEVHYTVTDLAPGTYTVRCCWIDDETYQQECYEQEVLIGGSRADLDGDGSVNLNDFATFALCYTGAGATSPPPGCTPEEFAQCDLTGDGDVDLGDFAEFALEYQR
ncbi:MAG: hypothetical protein JSU68_04030 [Phycisphaerales bacterium]|nr:MAG: hypothetical protein JSU68_04030 [Phycisphaerales bacterium]